MFWTLIIQALGSMGLFASRAFVPAFAAALILRIGPSLPFGLDEKGMLGALNIAAATPTWFTSNGCLLVLGILAGLEIAATKNPDARAILNELDKYAKPVMAALTVMGVASAGDVAFAGSIIGAIESSGGSGLALALVPVLAAGLTWSMIPAAFSAAGTFAIATTRSFVMGLFIDADEDDDIGFQKLLSWGEDLWALFGLFFFILFPIIMLILIGLATGFIFLIKWWVHRKEEQSRVPCGNCGALMYRCAMKCGQCRTVNPNVCDVGWLGQSDTDDPADLPSHPYQLAAAKRCPTCATKLQERRPRQSCPGCGDDPFASPAFTKAYVDRIGARLPLVLLICAGLGVIYIVGVIPAVIVYRMSLVAPFRRYIPRGRNFAMKWGLRLVFFVLLALQIFPAVGAVTVPVMALLSFLAYRQMFVAMVDDEDHIKEQSLITEPSPA
ncbi:MAG: hypothetical protein AAF911_14805 [Planctomycetota bacterium]